MSAPSSSGDRVVPALARELAARLSALFERDVEIVSRLNDAQRRVRDANERLWSGVSPDAFGLIYDGIGPAGSSQIAALIMDNARDAETAVLDALQQIHWSIHRGFCEYQSACEGAANSPWTWARSPPSSLRRGEVAGLTLDDIDWRVGELVVVGKGARQERLPLPTVVSYCTSRAPVCGFCVDVA
jgi:hypothetical protein